MQANSTTASTKIGQYSVIIDNAGCLHFYMAGFQLQLKRSETQELLDFLNSNINVQGASTTTGAGDPSADVQGAV